MRQESDELIEDLEHQLGSTLTEYLCVRVAYRHSGFPQQGTSSILDGVTSLSTTLKTSAVAVIRRHNSSSLWAARPAPRPNLLFEIVARHWGHAAANEVVRRMVLSRSTLRKVAHPFPSPKLQPQFSSVDDAPAKTPQPTRLAPPVPRRQASLQQSLGGRSSPGDDIPAETHDNEHDPARSIWAHIRRVSNGGKFSLRASKMRRLPSTAQHFPATNGSARPSPRPSLPAASLRNIRQAYSNSERPWGEDIRYRETVHAQVLRNTRSADAETLRTPVTTAREMGIDGKVKETECTGGESGLYMKQGYVGEGGSGIRAKKETGRWGWNSWW